MRRVSIIGAVCLGCVLAESYDATVRAWGHFSSELVTGTAVVKQWYVDEPVEFSLQITYKGRMGPSELTASIHTLAASRNSCGKSGLPYDPYFKVEGAYSEQCEQDESLCSVGDLSRSQGSLTSDNLVMNSAYLLNADVNNLENKSFAIHKHDGENIACATLRKDAIGPDYTARFTSGDVVGSIRASEGDDTDDGLPTTNVLLNLVNRVEKFKDYRWYIRDLEVPNGQNSMCGDLGPIYDPENKIQTSYRNGCDSDPNNCAVGDQLRRVAGDLRVEKEVKDLQGDYTTHLTLKAAVPIERMPLYGKDTIAGRSVLILRNGAPIACATLQAVDIRDPNDLAGNVDEDPRQFLVDNGVLEELEHEYNPHALGIALGVLFGIIGLVLFIVLICWDSKRREQAKEKKEARGYYDESNMTMTRKSSLPRNSLVARTKSFIKSKRGSGNVGNQHMDDMHRSANSMDVPDTPPKSRTVAERSIDFFSAAAAKLKHNKKSEEHQYNDISQRPPANDTDEDSDEIREVTYSQTPDIVRGETNANLKMKQFENMTSTPVQGSLQSIHHTTNGSNGLYNQPPQSTYTPSSEQATYSPYSNSQQMSGYASNNSLHGSSSSLASNASSSQIGVGPPPLGNANDAHNSRLRYQSSPYVGSDDKQVMQSPYQSTPQLTHNEPSNNTHSNAARADANTSGFYDV